MVYDSRLKYSQLFFREFWEISQGMLKILQNRYIIKYRSQNPILKNF